MSHEPDPRLLPVATPRDTLAELARRLRRLPWSTGAAIVTVLAASLSGLVAPWVLGRLVDDIDAGAGMPRVWNAVLLIVGAALATGVCTGLGAWLVARVGETVLARLRETVLDRVLRLGSPTVDKVRIGDLLARVGDDVAVVTSAVTSTGPELVTAVFTVVLTGIGLFALDFRLGLAGLVAIPVYLLALRWYLPRSGPYYARERVAMGERSQAVVGTLQATDTVRAYRLERPHHNRIARRSGEAMNLTIAVFGLFGRFVGRINRAEFVGLSTVLVVGFLLVRADATTIGATTAAALYFHRLFNPLGVLVTQFDDIQSAGAALARLVGVVQLPRAESRHEPPEIVDATLDIKGVSHGYDGGERVLCDVDLTIAAGERVALVGASGAGKTTLAAIAAGEFAPVAGEVRLGGVALSDMSDERLRSAIVMITQQVHVFSGTLADNVALARGDATGDEIVAALEHVDAMAWVRGLPDGLDTVVGEGAHRLTAAQAQHLALARVVLADPAVAILDEATAEAGSAGARQLEAAVEAATRGRTTVVVAHRLTQAAAADRILVMEAGRVVESGGHDELSVAGGRYETLWRSWSTRSSALD